MATRAQTSIAVEYGYRPQRDPDPCVTPATSRFTNQCRELPSLTLANVRLGQFEVDLRAGELRTGNESKRLQEQPFRILQMLVHSDGQVVTREEIRKALWGEDTIVDFDHSINTAVRKLRRSLRDSAGHPTYVETIARRGYRLMLPVLSLQREKIALASPPLQVAHTDRSCDSAEDSCQDAFQPLRMQVLDGGIERAGTAPPLRAQRPAICKLQGDMGEAFGEIVQRKELEHRLRRLEKLVSARNRRQRPRRRCLPHRIQGRRPVAVSSRGPSQLDQSAGALGREPASES